MKISTLAEPLLEFGTGTHICPRAGIEQMVLSDDLVQALGPHPVGERAARGIALGGGGKQVAHGSGVPRTPMKIKAAARSPPVGRPRCRSADC